MNGASPAVRFLGPPPGELRRRLYRALARELLASPEPAAVVIETSTADRRSDVTVCPAGLLGTLGVTPVFRGALTWRSPGAPTPPADPEHLAVGWVARPLRPKRTPPVPAGPWDRPSAAGLLGPGGVLELQTFWATGRTDGQLWAARRARYRAPSLPDLPGRQASTGRFVAAEWSTACGLLCEAAGQATTDPAWSLASTASIPRDAWVAVPASAADRTAEPTWPDEPAIGPRADGHTVVLGATGSGKTTFLAERAARAIAGGTAVLAIDLHGDLSPGIMARLTPAERTAVVAVDASERPVVGVAALRGGDDRAAAQLVAAVKRLSPDGEELYWGFRLERIFDSFVRLVQESGGTLVDLYRLLTDADRREAVRLSTRSAELARFLDDLAPIVRRNPEFLWGAASRLAKVVLLPELAELLAPVDGGVPVEELLRAGRSVLVRVPFSSVGPEAAAFAGSLVLARCYLGLAGRGSRGPARPVAVVLDEVQGLSPRLVAEMLTEGRKFGLRLLVASQFPERLAPELRLAAAGVAREVVAFRVPPASAARVGPWLGLAPAEAERSLVELPVGVGLARGAETSELRSTVAGEPPRAPVTRTWEEATARTREEFGAKVPGDPLEVDAVTERLLLAVLQGEEGRAPVPREDLPGKADELPGPPVDRAVLADRLVTLEREGLASADGGRWHLSPAGERRLGLRATTGATCESAEHRLLLLRAFRIFARHGRTLEIVRQGRYDTALPDGLFRQIPDGVRRRPARELREELERAREGWAWRCFGGLDVHVEAEVSGALRPARIRHGLEKARHRGAFPLFVVGDAARAARVRRTLRAEGLGPDRAQVWTLRVDPEFRRP